jgi:hypothetical protein
MLPDLPFVATYKGVARNVSGYVFKGQSTYGETMDGLIPLRLCRVPGEWEQPCPEFQLKTRPFIPEVRVEWKYPETI